MANLQKTVLMVQASERQKAIWYAALTSQTISVLQESANADLYQVVDQAKTVGELPDLLLLDTGITNLNPYKFCRFCYQQRLNLKIILTHGAQNEVTSAERRWAIYQKAQDLLPGLQQETLSEQAVARVSRVLEVLNCPPSKWELLAPVLLSLTSSSAPLVQKTTADVNNSVVEAAEIPSSPELELKPDDATPAKRKGHSYRS